MDTDTNEPVTPDTLAVENTPKKTPNVFMFISIIAFVILVIAVNATAVYFGSKKNKAFAPPENPVTATDENTGSSGEQQDTVLPENEQAVSENTAESENTPENVSEEELR